MNNNKPIPVLNFTDIYINLKKPEDNSYLFYKELKQVVPIDCETAIHAKKLADIIDRKYKQSGRSSFRVGYLDRLYRVTLIKSVDGLMAECRSQPKMLIPLDQIGLPTQVKNWTLNERLCGGGLILVVGQVGSGKTTSCVAIAKSRIEKFGGVLLTIEDPVELPMHGSIGNGLCIQYEIETKEDFLEAGRLALRCYPADKAGIMFIGEIRDSKSASLALQASLDGRLVVATIHGDSVISALQRLISYASDDMGAEEAYSLLAHGFRLCLHQKMEKDSLKVEFLVDTDPVVGLIKEKRIGSLGTNIDSQYKKLLNNDKITLRRI